MQGQGQAIDQAISIVQPGEPPIGAARRWPSRVQGEQKDLLHTGPTAVAPRASGRQHVKCALRSVTHFGRTDAVTGWPTAATVILALLLQAASMGATKVFRHENYELHCSASVIGNGEFLPAVVVIKQIWPTRPRNIAVRSDRYLTEEIAIEAARTQGIEWIVSYG